MRQPSNYHVFKVIYLPITAKLSARVKIISERFQQSITEAIDQDKFLGCEQYHDVAVAQLSYIGYNIIAIGSGWGCMYVISDTFEPLYKP